MRIHKPQPNRVNIAIWPKECETYHHKDALISILALPRLLTAARAFSTVIKQRAIILALCSTAPLEVGTRKLSTRRVLELDTLEPYPTSLEWWPRLSAFQRR
jgi:hypothetical protein